MIYKSQSEAIPGLVYGFTEENIESKIANAQTEMGKAAFYQLGDQDKAYKADSGNANLKFGGVIPYKHISYKGSFGVIPAGEQVEVLRQGEIWVELNSAEVGVMGKPAYVYNVIATPANYDYFTAVTTASYNTGGIFKSNVLTVTSTDFAAQSTPITKYLAVIEVHGLA
jgi:hypothetical protein